MKRARNFLLPLWAALLLLPNLAAHAQEDGPQPITIEADRAELNEPDQISIYSGNVVLKQGGLTIWSEEMRIYLENSELQRVEAEGTPARYEQIRAGEDTIRGQSLKLNYEAATETILFLQDAELLQGENRFTGERIQYDINSRKVLASGAENGQASDGGRVRITIQPKQADGAMDKP